MDENRIESKQEIVDKYWGKWDFINPRWPMFLMVVESVVYIVLSRFVDEEGVRITGDIILKRAVTGVNDITVIGIISVIIHVVLIVGILYISVWVLPPDKRHNRLRLAGIFVMVGSLLKVILAFVGQGMRYIVEVGGSFKLPMITCTDLYMLGGFIAMIIIVATKYSNQDMEEIRAWKASRAKKET